MGFMLSYGAVPHGIKRILTSCMNTTTGCCVTHFSSLRVNQALLGTTDLDTYVFPGEGILL